MRNSRRKMINRSQAMRWNSRRPLWAVGWGEVDLWLPSFFKRFFAINRERERERERERDFMAVSYDVRLFWLPGGALRRRKSISTKSIPDCRRRNYRSKIVFSSSSSSPQPIRFLPPLYFQIFSYHVHSWTKISF